MCPKLIELLSWNGPTVHVCCFMLARASTKTFVSRVQKTAGKNLRQAKNSLAGSLVGRDITVQVTYKMFNKCIYVRSEVLTAVLLQIQGFWHIAPSRLDRRFERSQCIHLQGLPVLQQSLRVFTLLGLLELGAEGTMILQKVRNYFSIDTVSNPRRLAYSHLHILQSFRNTSCLAIFKKSLINQYLRTHSFSSQYLVTPFPSHPFSISFPFISL